MIFHQIFILQIYLIQLMPQQDSQGNYPTIKDFVLQEAHQRAFQIHVIGLKEFEKERNNLLNQKQDALHGEIQKKQKQQLAAARIHRSSLINGSRMKKMEARHHDLLEIVSSTQSNISKSITSNREKYCGLLQKLILEGLIKMLEPVVYVRCLQRDSESVESVFGKAKQEFKKLIAKQGIEESVGNVELKLDTRYLEERVIKDKGTERVDKSEENFKCFGGVILTNEDGNIVCKNTLDSRVELAYQHMLPTIRRQLYR